MLSQLVHAYDAARQRLDLDNPDSLACSEVRAARLSGECDGIRAFLKHPLVGPIEWAEEVRKPFPLLWILPKVFFKDTLFSRLSYPLVFYSRLFKFNFAAYAAVRSGECGREHSSPFRRGEGKVR